MKKVFLLLVLFSMVACEQDDNDGVAINEENIAGKWYFESSRLNADDYVLYDHNCATEHDYIELFADGTAKEAEFSSSCEEVAPEDSATWTLDGTTFTYTDNDPGAVPSVMEVKILNEYKLSLQRTDTLDNDEVEVRVFNFSRN